VSDNDTGTNYQVAKSKLYQVGTYEMLNFKFDETSGTILYDSSPVDYVGTYNNSPNLTIQGFDNTAVDFDGVDDFAEVFTGEFFINTTEDFMICMGFRGYSNLPNDAPIIDHRIGANSGWDLLGHDDELRFTTDRDGSGTKNHDTYFEFDDNTWHKVCFFSGFTQMISYVDGVFDAQTNTEQTGSLTGTSNFIYIGTNEDVEEFTDFSMDELCIIRGVNLNHSDIADKYNQTGTCEYSLSDSTQGKAIVGRWSETYDQTFNWFLRLYKTTLSNSLITVRGYDTSNDVSVMNVTKEFNGQGWLNVNVTSLMDYEKNTQNLTFSQFRVYTKNEANFSEMLLRAEVNDTEPPVINTSQCVIKNADTDAIQTEFGCLESIKFECTGITDNLDVDYVLFEINNVNETTTQNIDQWDYFINPLFNGTQIYDWDYVTATDIVGLSSTETIGLSANYTCIYEDYINITHSGINGIDQLNKTNVSIVIYWTTTNPSDSTVEYGVTPSNLSNLETNPSDVTQHYISLTGLSPNTTYYYDVTSTVNPTQTLTGFNFTTLSGLLCVEDWTEDSIVCLTNDTYLSTFRDNNACGTYDDLPAQNGTYQYCNYCSEDLVQVLGNCQSNLTQTVNYNDNNFFSCCFITDLISDCSILHMYPYNETTSQACTFFNNTMSDISCQNEPNFRLREKEYCLSYIPNQYLNETFKCISHIKNGDTNEIMQTNPEYRERAQSFIEFGQDPETREYFAPASSIVNFYYTQKNLLPEQDYILTIECSSQQRTLSSSMNFQMAYEDYEFVFFRTRWLMANAPYVIGGLLFLIILMFIIFAVWRTGTV
jgi:hypothetical protein